MMCLRKVICFGLGLFCIIFLSVPVMASDTPTTTDREIQHPDDTRDEEAYIRDYDMAPISPVSYATNRIYKRRARREIRMVKRAPQSLRDRIKDGNYPNQAGMIGSNRGGWKCAAYQRGGMLRLWLAAVDGDQWAVNDARRAIDATFARQNPNGSFQIGGGMPADYVDRLSDVAFWLSKLCHALLIVQVSEVGPAFQSRIDALLPKIELSGSYLASGAAVLSNGDREAANRLFFDACAFGLAGALTGNQQFVNLGRQFADQGVGEQRGDGVFLEMNGHDSSYQGVSLLQFQQYAVYFPSAAYNASLLKGAQWEVTRILPSGEIDPTGNTRTGRFGKPLSYIEVMMGLLYAGGGQNYMPAVDAGLRCYSYFYHVPIPTMDITGYTDMDDERLQPSLLLHQNYPNPFRETTTVGYTLSSGERVHAAIYNTLGQRVRTLVDGYSPNGYSQVTWDSRDDAGTRVAPGVYVIRIETPFATETRKLSLVE
jgi:hypothetical protein